MKLLKDLPLINRGSTDLGLRLLTLYLLFVIPIFALLLFFYTRASQQLREDFATADISLARVIAVETYFTLSKANLAAADALQIPVIVNADLQDITETIQARHSLPPQPSQISLSNPTDSTTKETHSILAIPLCAVHAPPSTLLVHKTGPYNFGKREIELLTSFANQAAMAIENTTLYAQSDAQLRQQTYRLESLIQSLEEGLILENLEGQVIYANRAIAKLIGPPMPNQPIS